MPRSSPGVTMRVAATVVLSTVMLFGCGGNTPTTPKPEPFVISHSDLIGAMSAPRIGYQAPMSGQMSFEVSWGNPEINVDLYMTPQGCLEFAGCGIMERSEAATGTQERVSRSVLVGEQLTFYVVNRSQVNQAVAMRFAIE